MRDELLQAFFGKSLSHWNLSKDDDPRFFSEVICFIESLNNYGITGNKINVDSLGIFRHKGIRKTIETFAHNNPQHPLPLEEITIIQYVSAESCRSDLERIQTDLSAVKEEMLCFATAFSIKISFNIYVSGFDAGISSRICESMDTGSIDTINFIFSFPSASDNRVIADIRSEIATFLNNPESKKSGIYLANFPLCFAPASEFKALCRFSLDGLKSLINFQRDTIKDVFEQTHDFLPNCRTCRSKAFCYAFTDIEKHLDYDSAVTPLTNDTVAFTGGSLPKSEYINESNIVYTSPAEQGDMLAAILAGFNNILIIDGYFYTKFPCTTFEVMLALEKGLNVFGAASIGALRAVELDNYGMTGIGYVYDYLKKQPVSPYHIVAQTYREDNTALTIPLVDIIYFLDCAVSENIITGDDSQLCLRVAEKISFPMLYFEYFLRSLREQKIVEAETIDRLEGYLTGRGHRFFSIKKKDAIKLLTSYQGIMAQRGPEYTARIFLQARDKHLNLLYRKYRREPNLCLPGNWKELRPTKPDDASAQRDRRDLSPLETCRLAREFFHDMSIILSDTTGYDPPTGSYIINTFFIPFYFLGYPLSSATGNGDIYEEALASAYMELVERIPTHQFNINTIKTGNPGKDFFPLAQIPQHYNLCASPEIKQKIVDDHGYVKATDIISGNEVLIPAFAVMSMFAGSDGNAAGNSYAEAILYGIYETVERDTNQIYLRDSVCDTLRSRLRIDPDTIDETRCRTLIAHLTEKGYKIAIYYLHSTFNLPCIRCQVFDTNRNIECHGSTAVRADFNSALYAALHEAYMQHISYFAGIRDDYHSFLARKTAQASYRNAQARLFGPHPDYLKHKIQPTCFTSLRDELDHVIKRVTSANIRHILVANTSPMDKYIIKSVKVIIPGTELWFVPEYQPSDFIGERIMKTRLAIKYYLD